MYYIIRLEHKQQINKYFYTNTGKIVDYRDSHKYKQYKNRNRAIQQADTLAKQYPFLIVRVMAVDFEVKDYLPGSSTIVSRYANTFEEAQAITLSGETQGTTEIITREQLSYKAA